MSPLRRAWSSTTSSLPVLAILITILVVRDLWRGERLVLVRW